MPEQLTDFGLYPPTGWSKTPTTIASHNRLLLTETTDEVDLQLKLEQLAVLQSIRGILFAVLVVVPAVVIAAAVVILLATQPR